jgi:hypothetical protein
VIFSTLSVASRRLIGPFCGPPRKNDRVSNSSIQATTLVIFVQQIRRFAPPPPKIPRLIGPFKDHQLELVNFCDPSRRRRRVHNRPFLEPLHLCFFSNLRGAAVSTAINGPFVSHHPSNRTRQLLNSNIRHAKTQDSPRFAPTPRVLQGKDGVQCPPDAGPLPGLSTGERTQWGMSTQSVCLLQTPRPSVLG